MRVKVDVSILERTYSFQDVMLEVIKNLAHPASVHTGARFNSRRTILDHTIYLFMKTVFLLQLITYFKYDIPISHK